MNSLSYNSISNLWDVFLLFTIPIGGGIPAGVVLGQKNNVGWLMMTILYFLSDIALAIVFEPLMLMFMKFTKNSLFVAKFREEFKKNTNRILSRYSDKPSVFSLVTIAFGVDPMTGRAAAMMAGHHCISGWAITILGDMFFFLVIMGSTLWLNNILGDGTMSAIIIMVLMFLIPLLIRRFKDRKNK